MHTGVFFLTIKVSYSYSADKLWGINYIDSESVLNLSMLSLKLVIHGHWCISATFFNGYCKQYWAYE